MISSDQVALGVNGSGTCQKIDAPLTQVGSRDVPAGLIRMRRAHGHDTPIGHRCSNILEMLDAGTAKPADIARQVAELSSLVSKGEL